MALRLLLFPLGLLYGPLVLLRGELYRRGVLKTQSVKTPVVAVGNLTLGGSGKTPVVEWLLRQAQAAGLRGAAVSRGYGGRSRGALMRVCLAEGVPAAPSLMGDEPCLLARRNPTLPVYVGRDRAAAARLAEVLDGPDVIVLDDAFQHLRLARDLNVLLVDAERGLGNGWTLPWGPLREPASAAARADVILITKANLGDAAGLARRLVERHRATAPIFTCEFRPARLVRLDEGAELPPHALAGKEVSLLCAIAQPAGFANVVTALGAHVKTVHALRDHHPYGPAELARIEPLLGGAGDGAPDWVTTEKDAVKLRGRLPGERMWVLEMEVIPEPAATAFFFDFLSALPLK